MNNQALYTDLYQITMLAEYFHDGKHKEPAKCEMFVRRLPKNRRFILAAGLEQVLDYLYNLRFTDAQIEALKEIPTLRSAMTQDFVDYLRAFHFTGKVSAVPEGTVLFENEPFIRVEAELAQAQLVETFILSTINHQSMIASKAARIVLAAGGKSVLEFGSRRTHPAAAVDVARAAYIAGFDGSSNVEAFYRYGVPARGTMAHMFIMAYGDEEKAFEKYNKVFGKSLYLVDTYDTLTGVRNALKVAGDNLLGVRLDSGDLASLSKEVRALLKDEGREDVKIFLSSDLDEYELVELNERGEYDGAGVGTRLATSDDAPSLGGVYKLVEINEQPVAKFSEGKITYPGPKQVYRHYTNGQMDSDIIGHEKEGRYDFVNKIPLLKEVMRNGAIIHRESIHEMRERARVEVASLPDVLKEIGVRTDERSSYYEVSLSEKVRELLADCERRQMNNGGSK